VYIKITNRLTGNYRSLKSVTIEDNEVQEANAQSAKIAAYEKVFDKLKTENILEEIVRQLQSLN
jgi:hypothetical protein